jgi:hypothetical protein
MCWVLNMYNGDRSNPNYLQTKNNHFREGAGCDCGAVINETSYDKKTCEATKALANHMVFPTYKLLDKCNKKDNLNHWAFIVEINSIVDHSTFYGFTPLDEIVFLGYDYFDQETVTTFSYSDIKVGHTVVALYAEKEPKHEDKKLIVIRDPDFLFVFNASFLDVKKEAEKLLNSSDSKSEKKELECFGCGIKISKLIITCSKCKLAHYCSTVCQKNSWNVRHKDLCKQSEVLLRLACLPRHQETLPYEYFTFNLDEKLSLPPYVYKPEFVQKKLSNTELVK